MTNYYQIRIDDDDNTEDYTDIWNKLQQWITKEQFIEYAFYYEKGKQTSKYHIQGIIKIHEDDKLKIQRLRKSLKRLRRDNYKNDSSLTIAKDIVKLSSYVSKDGVEIINNLNKNLQEASQEYAKSIQKTLKIEKKKQKSFGDYLWEQIENTKDTYMIQQNKYETHDKNRYIEYYRYIQYDEDRAIDIHLLRNQILKYFGENSKKLNFNLIDDFMDMIKLKLVPLKVYSEYRANSIQKLKYLYKLDNNTNTETDDF